MRSKHFIFIETCKEDISDVLEDMADSYFDTWFEDGSVDDVASHLWSESRDFLAGNRDKIKSFVESNSKVLAPCPIVDSQSDDDDNGECDKMVRNIFVGIHYSNCGI